MWRRVLLVLVLAVAVPALVFAGTTGKIRGQVTDNETGEPLIGANVLVQGTTFGAATDLDGGYVILNVPVGAQTVRASFVGYHSFAIRNVRVNSDLTTEVNFTLTSEAIEIDVVEVTAERPLVNKYATNAVRIVGSEDIQSLPVRGLTSVFALQAGVVLQDNMVYIRGGRADEVGYYLEGADVRNPMTGGTFVTLIPEAVEEVQVQAGGYNAEYGGANAGIVRQQLRTGSRDYRAMLQVETDNFTGENDKSLGTYSYGYWDYVLTLSGPVYSDKVRFFLAGENEFMRDPNPIFWEGFRFENLVDDGERGGIPGDTLEVLELLPGNVPGRMLSRYNANGTISFDFNPLLFRVSGGYTWMRRKVNNAPIRTMLNQRRIPINEQKNAVLNLKTTYIVDPKTFVEVNLNYFDFRDELMDPDFREDYLAYGDSARAAEKGYQYLNSTFAPQPYDFFGFPFMRPGATEAGDPGPEWDQYSKSKQTYIGGGLDFTTQQGVHELKLGGTLQKYSARSYSIFDLSALLTSLRANPTAEDGSDADLRGLLFRTNGKVNTFGYDLEGNETEVEGFKGPRNPLIAAAYIQDRIEFKDLVINAGLRFDYFDTDDFTFADLKNPGFNLTDFDIDEETLVEIDAFKFISPRLGMSFPVTDRTVFHLQFGKFVQLPQLNSIYVGTAELARIFSGRNFIPDPVGFGLEPIKTTQYEVGFTQQFTDFASFDITAFYRDIKGQILLDKIETTSGVAAQGYNILANGDFSTTKGLELNITLRRVNRLQAQINYTLSDSKGTGSTLTSAISGIEQATDRPTYISPLRFNQTHRGTINFDYRFGKNDGGPVLERLGANVLLTFNSGHPYTKVFGSIGQRDISEGNILGDDDPRSRKPLEPVNASTTPWVFNIDLRVDKVFSLGRIDATLYIYVQNLLDTKNVINVYGRTGNADDDSWLGTPEAMIAAIAQDPEGNGQGYINMYRAVNLANREHYRMTQGLQDARLQGFAGSLTPSIVNADLFGSPRQIRFGIRIAY